MTTVPYGNGDVTKHDGPHARPFRVNLALLDRLDEIEEKKRGDEANVKDKNQLE